MAVGSVTIKVTPDLTDVISALGALAATFEGMAATLRECTAGLDNLVRLVEPDPPAPKPDACAKRAGTWSGFGSCPDQDCSFRIWTDDNLGCHPYDPAR
jgi:hypothetical protein